MSTFLKNYFTDEKIMETWAKCEEHGANTMICYPEDKHGIHVYEKYRARGGAFNTWRKSSGGRTTSQPVRKAIDSGAVGAFLLGNAGDLWTRDGSVALIGELLSINKDHDLIAGVAGHELRTPMAIEKAGFEPDFYMKALHRADYWSGRKPDQNKEVIDNYSIDNYWCMDPEETIHFMRAVKRPWMAYKVLAAGAIHPREGFRHAFENGADFAVVGMFDFQVAEDAAIASQVLSQALKRDRPWLA